MDRSHLLRMLAPVVLAASLSGCASIMSGAHKTIDVNSNPSGAHVVVQDKKGRQHAMAVTPAEVSIKRSRGFFVPNNFVVRVSKEGYATQEVPLNLYPNPWWFPGNGIFGGLLGFLIIDPATGAMWNYYPSRIDVNLVRIPGRTTSKRQVD